MAYGASKCKIFTVWKSFCSPATVDQKTGGAWQKDKEPYAVPFLWDTRWFWCQTSLCEALVSNIRALILMSKIALFYWRHRHFACWRKKHKRGSIFLHMLISFQNICDPVPLATFFSLFTAPYTFFSSPTGWAFYSFLLTEPDFNPCYIIEKKPWGPFSFLAYTSTFLFFFSFSRDP